MQKVALKIMRKVVADLPTNCFAHELLRYVQHEKRLKNQSNFSEMFRIDIYDNSEFQLSLSQNDIALHKDYRFKRLYLKNFRKYPAISDDSFYGLNFVNLESNIPDSFFYVGSNGTGKTSLFSAMEELCTGRISAAAFRYYKGDEIKRYIPYWGTSYNDVNIFLDAIVGNYSYHDEKERINFSNEEKELFSAFFTSENDYLLVSENKDDITSFVYNQIGFGYIYQILLQLDSEKKTIIEFKKNNDGKELIDPNKEFAQNRIKVQVLTSLLSYVWNISKIGNSSGLLEKHDNIINNSGVNLLLSDSLNSKDNCKELLPLLEKEKKELEQLYPDVEFISNFYSNQIEQIRNIFNEPINQNRESMSDRFRKNKLLSIFNKSSLRQPNVDLNLFKIGRSTLLDTLRGALLVIKDKSLIEEFYHNISQDIFLLTERNKKLLFEKDLVLSDYEKKILYEKHYASLSDTYDCLKKHFVDEVRWAIDCLKKIVIPIFDLFAINDEEFKLIVNENQYTFEIRVYDKKEIDKWTYPRLYLNSFRYKLYCICLRISIAFCVKHYFDINFPLVFDDIFYSSDFVNRERVEDFIEKIITIHNDLFHNDESPLQILFFTHDTLILNAATNGAKKISFPFHSGRIFDEKEVEGDDVLNVNNIKIYQLADLYKY